MSRAAAREQAFKLLYQCDIMSAPPDEILETYTGLAGEDAAYPLLDQNDLDFLKQELFGAWEHKEEIDALIGRNTKDWKVNRLSRVLLAIMRIAVYEMCHQEDLSLIHILPGATLIGVVATAFTPVSFRS